MSSFSGSMKMTNSSTYGLLCFGLMYGITRCMKAVKRTVYNSWLM